MSALTEFLRALCLMFLRRTKMPTKLQARRRRDRERRPRAARKPRPNVITNATVARVLLLTEAALSAEQVAALLHRCPGARHVRRARERMAALVERGLVPAELVLVA